MLHGVLAYSLWGIVAAYWKISPLPTIDASELIAHRAIWGLVTFGVIALAVGQRRALVSALRQPRLLAVMTVSGVILASNWIMFVGATTSGHLLDASLGYFINPLVSIALGTLLLGEQLRRGQWIAIALATIGVGVLTYRTGHVPWIALALAVTFGLYGLIRKVAKVDALVGSTVETAVLALIAVVYLALRGGGAIMHADARLALLLAGTGIVTALPLVLFTSAARRLPLSTVGFLQYLAPTGQFLLAVLAYGEPLAPVRLFAFAWIWAGLAVFAIDGVVAARASAR